MDSLKVSVCKPGEGDPQELDLNNKEDMQGILKCLNMKGYVVLKGAVTVKDNWDAGIQNFSNDPYVHTIMNKARSGGFTIYQYEAARAGTLQKKTIPMTRPPSKGPKSPNFPHFMGFVAFYLGGKSIWFISVEMEGKGYSKPVFEEVSCKGGDVFLCDTRLAYTNPVPGEDEEGTMNVVRILFLRKNM